MALTARQKKILVVGGLSIGALFLMRRDAGAQAGPGGGGPFSSGPGGGGPFSSMGSLASPSLVRMPNGVTDVLPSGALVPPGARVLMPLPTGLNTSSTAMDILRGVVAAGGLVLSATPIVARILRDGNETQAKQAVKQLDTPSQDTALEAFEPWPRLAVVDITGTVLDVETWPLVDPADFPLTSFDTRGFTFSEILDPITGMPIDAPVLVPSDFTLSEVFDTSVLSRTDFALHPGMEPLNVSLPGFSDLPLAETLPPDVLQAGGFASSVDAAIGTAFGIVGGALAVTAIGMGIYELVNAETTDQRTAAALKLGVTGVGTAVTLAANAAAITAAATTIPALAPVASLASMLSPLAVLGPVLPFVAIAMVVAVPLLFSPGQYVQTRINDARRLVANFPQDLAVLAEVETEDDLILALDLLVSTGALRRLSDGSYAIANVHLDTTAYDASLNAVIGTILVDVLGRRGLSPRFSAIVTLTQKFFPSSPITGIVNMIQTGDIIGHFNEQMLHLAQDPGVWRGLMEAGYAAMRTLGFPVHDGPHVDGSVLSPQNAIARVEQFRALQMTQQVIRETLAPTIFTGSIAPVYAPVVSIPPGYRSAVVPDPAGGSMTVYISPDGSIVTASALVTLPYTPPPGFRSVVVPDPEGGSMTVYIPPEGMHPVVVPDPMGGSMTVYILPASTPAYESVLQPTVYPSPVAQLYEPLLPLIYPEVFLPAFVPATGPSGEPVWVPAPVPVIPLEVQQAAATALSYSERIISGELTESGVAAGYNYIYDLYMQAGLPPPLPPQWMIDAAEAGTGE